MKIKQQLLGLALVLSVALFAFKPAADEYTVDTKASTVEWTGSHIVKGYDHVGFISIKTGSLEVEDGKIIGGSFVLDMNSITNTDQDDAKKNAKLVNHLKSDDFFSASKYPEAKLVIKSSGGGKVTADITIKGKTESITFDTATSADGGKFVAEASFAVDRTKFGVEFGSSLGKYFVADEFKLKIKLVASK